MTSNPGHCPHCARQFSPGTHWPGANFCRALFLLPYIEEHPGLSAWELSQATGMMYGDVTGALQKARERGAVLYTEEGREQGGVRFRYHVSPNWRPLSATWWQLVDTLNQRGMDRYAGLRP